MSGQTFCLVDLLREFLAQSAEWSKDEAVEQARGLALQWTPGESAQSVLVALSKVLANPAHARNMDALFRPIIVDLSMRVMEDALQSSFRQAHQAVRSLVLITPGHKVIDSYVFSR